MICTISVNSNDNKVIDSDDTDTDYCNICDNNNNNNGDNDDDNNIKPQLCETKYEII